MPPIPSTAGSSSIRHVKAITKAGALGCGSVSVASGSTGALRGASLTFANPLSVSGGVTPTLGQSARNNNTPTFTGGATGSGNLVFNDNRHRHSDRFHRLGE